jgi:hypothetical protein
MPGVPMSAKIEDDGSVIHVVCHDYTGGGGPNIFYFHSLDRGYSFSDGVQLDTDSLGWAQIPSIAANGLTVHVVYEQHHPGWPVQVAYRRSLNGGFSWEDPVILNSDAIRPKVACEGDSVYVIYDITDEPRHSRFRRSLNNGADWSEETVLEPEAVNADIVACDGIVYYVYWDTPSSIEIFLRRGLNGGELWENPVQVSESPDHHSQIPRLSVQPGGTVCVSWMDYENSPMMWTGYIYTRTSNNYGIDWEPIQVVSESYYCLYNDIEICEGAIHVVFMDERYGSEHSNIHYRQSPDGGINWLPEERICADSSQSQFPVIAAASDQVSVAWEWHQVGVCSEIFYRAGDIVNGTVFGEIPETPDVFQLLIPYPNPSNSFVIIPFISQGHGKNLTLKIVNIRGETVQHWTLGPLAPGEHAIRWDGLGSGAPVASGSYYVVLSDELMQYVRPVTLIK